jgi:hypothetical protein
MAKRNKNVHVIPSESGWAVKKEGSSRASSVHGTKREAESAGRELARNQETELIIHGRDGRIRGRDSYGNDPLPPKEPREVLFPTTPTTISKKDLKEAIKEIVQESNSSSRKETQNESRG